MLGSALVCSARVVADGYPLVETLNELNHFFAPNNSTMKFFIQPVDRAT